MERFFVVILTVGWSRLFDQLHDQHHECDHQEEVDQAAEGEGR
jgi:hypothetical protein